MSQKTIKKISIYFVFFVYIFFISFANLPLFWDNKVYAKWNQNKVNLNLIIVDKDIYNDIKSSLES